MAKLHMLLIVFVRYPWLYNFILFTHFFFLCFVISGILEVINSYWPLDLFNNINDDLSKPAEELHKIVENERHTGSSQKSVSSWISNIWNRKYINSFSDLLMGALGTLLMIIVGSVLYSLFFYLPSSDQTNDLLQFVHQFSSWVSIPPIYASDFLVIAQEFDLNDPLIVLAKDSLIYTYNQLSEEYWITYESYTQVVKSLTDLFDNTNSLKEKKAICLIITTLGRLHIMHIRKYQVEWEDIDNLQGFWKNFEDIFWKDHSLIFN